MTCKNINKKVSAHIPLQLGKFHPVFVAVAVADVSRLCLLPGLLLLLLLLLRSRFIPCQSHYSFRFWVMFHGICCSSFLLFFVIFLLCFAGLSDAVLREITFKYVLELTP